MAALTLTITIAHSAPPAQAKEPIFDFGAAGTQGGQFNAARGIAINEGGAGGVAAGTLYVLDFNNKRVQSFDASGAFLRAWGWDVIASGKPGDTGTGFEICEIAADCKDGTVGGKGGQFVSTSAAGGIAVAQSTGNVYVLDRGNGRVQEFDATGHFIRTWGKNVDSGGGTGAEICEVAANCQIGENGGLGGMFGFRLSGMINGIGADSAGNVYVADAGNARVQKFDSAGNFLAAGGWDVDSVGASTEYEVCTLAADCKAGMAGTGAGQFANESLCCPNYLTAAPGGDVYVVGRSDGTIYHLTPALAFDSSFAPAGVPGGAGENTRNALAFAGGHLFFTKKSQHFIYELDPATQLVLAEHEADAPYTPAADGTEWVGLAVNSTSGRIYGARTTAAGFVRVIGNAEVFPVATIEAPLLTSWTHATLKGAVDPEGVELSECKFEYGPSTAYGTTVPCAESPAAIGTGTAPVAVHADITGLQPNGAPYNARLVAANASGPDKSPNQPFETAEAVLTEAATAVSGATATLNGSANPLGHPLTQCLFEYGTTTAYGQSAPCAESPGEIGTGTSPVAVHADVGLDPGTEYHFRLRATNALDGAVEGEDGDLQTLGPSIEDAWAQDVGLSAATLKAKINPNGSPTTFHVEYGTSEAYGQSSAAQAVGSDSASHEVSALLEGLAPGTAYHWRVVATNADATSEGPDRAFATYRPLGAQSCENEAFRAGPSAGLPDCRAYEMVSPPDKGGGDIVAPTSFEFSREAAYRQAATDGSRLTYTSSTAFGDSVRGAYASQYLSSRNQDGWSTHGLLPQQGRTVFDPGSSLQYDLNTNFQAFTPDLCQALLRDHNLAPLTADAIAGFTNLYLRDNCGPGAGAYQALTVGEAPVFYAGSSAAAPGDLLLQARNYSADLSHIVFTAEAALESTPLAAATPWSKVYDFSEGALHLVSVLPGGDADTGFASVAVGEGHRQANLSRAVSGDGSRIFWSSSPTAIGARTLYVRVGGAETLQVSEPGADVEFWSASGDGGRALFSEGADLYQFDVDKALAEETASTLLAGEVGGVVGASEDLSRIYFTSEEVLAPGAIAGERNLYLDREGTLSLVATLAAADQNHYAADDPSPISRSARVTPDGQTLAFMSSAGLTGYDNADRASGGADSEVYLYDASADQLRCASCNPSGARPGGQHPFVPYTHGDAGFTAAAWLPTWEWSNYAKRALTDDGNRLFFNSFDALVPEDENEVQDVYQWEAPGTGGCTVEDPRYFAQNGGCLSLISTGHSKEGSEFMDASADGSDAFITTASNIDPRDLGFIDVYDTREGGGFPPPPPPKPPCLGDACQGVPAPPQAQTPASSHFEGPGNVREGPPRKHGCPRGKHRVLRHGKARCLKRQQRRADRRGRARG